MHDVFVSHSAKDKAVADAVVAHLEAAGIRCWVAPRDVLPGRIWSEEIVRAIEASKLMVLILSGNSNHSHQVLHEVDQAATRGLVILPLRTEPIELTAGLSYYLSSEHWLDAVTPPLESHIARLVDAAQQILGRTSDDEAAATTSREAASSGAATALTETRPVVTSPADHGKPRTRLVAAAVAGAAVLVAVVVAVVVLGGGGKGKPHAGGRSGQPTTAATTSSVSTTQSSTSPTSTASPAGTDDLAIAQKSCKLVNSADIKTVYGFDPGAGKPDGSTGFCDLGAGLPAVWIQQEGATEADYGSDRRNADADAFDVPNLGGGAFIEGSGTTDLTVFDPKRAIIFTMISADTGSKEEQRLEQLARLTLARA